MAVEATAPTLRIFGADPSIDDRQRGHAKLPQWIMALPDLPWTAKGVLEGIVCCCFNGERICRVTNRKLAEKCGLKPRIVKYWVVKLVELGFITRHEIIPNSGEPWETILLFDPLGLADTRPKRCPTPANPLSDPGQPIVRPQPIDCPPSYTFSQTELSFSDSPESLLAALPEKKPAPATPAPPTSPDPYRGPRDPGRPPEGYRWVYSQGSPRKEGVRPGLEPIPPRLPHGDQPERGIFAAIRAIKASLEDEAKAAAEMENGCGASRQSPPQPSGVQVPRPDRPLHDHTVKACSGQETGGVRENGQCARQDSNLQPSDSKGGVSVPDLSPESVISYDPSLPRKPPD